MVNVLQMFLCMYCSLSVTIIDFYGCCFVIFLNWIIIIWILDLNIVHVHKMSSNTIIYNTVP